MGIFKKVKLLIKNWRNLDLLKCQIQTLQSEIELKKCINDKLSEEIEAQKSYIAVLEDSCKR